MSTLVAIATYNERETLPTLVDAVREALPAADVLVVDDNSPDGTGELADELAAADPRIRVQHRTGKLGLGTATLAAYEHAIRENYDYLLNMDADFSHHPRYIPDLLKCMAAADVAIGSRYVPGGRIEGWGPLRHLMSRGVNFYARWLLGLKTRDNSGAFRCHRVDKLRKLDVQKIRATGYAFQEEVLYRFNRLGCRFAETPIVFEDRRYGQSKINLREAAIAVWVIFLLGLDRFRGVPVTRNAPS